VNQTRDQQFCGGDIARSVRFHCGGKGRIRCVPFSNVLILTFKDKRNTMHPHKS
jgi:hypothetical protein